MADLATLRTRNADFWADAAPGWIRHADWHDRVGRPLGAAALDWLAVRPGERVLDVGCGCGGTTAELAATVSPDGEALGIDLSAAMVAVARKRFPVPQHPGLRFLADDIEAAQDLPGAPYDAAFSRMVLMLLPDPVAGCRAVRDRLRPGGRLAATVFRDGGVNAWLPAAMLGAAAHVGPLPPLPVGDEPGPFAFADPDRVGSILVRAGFDAVSIEPHDVTMAAPDEPELVAEWLIELGPAGAAYRAAPVAQQAAAVAGAARLLDRYRDPGKGYRFTSGIWLITAVRPA